MLRLLFATVNPALSFVSIPLPEQILHTSIPRLREILLTLSVFHLTSQHQPVTVQLLTFLTYSQYCCANPTLSEKFFFLVSILKREAPNFTNLTKAWESHWLSFKGFGVCVGGASLWDRWVVYSDPKNSEALGDWVDAGGRYWRWYIFSCDSYLIQGTPPPQTRMES
jgi:hypothetical protein